MGEQITIAKSTQGCISLTCTFVPPELVGLVASNLFRPGFPTVTISRVLACRDVDKVSKMTARARVLSK